MKRPGFDQLSRRERQIMDILYQRGKASASEVREGMRAVDDRDDAAPDALAGRVGAQLLELGVAELGVVGRAVTEDAEALGSQRMIDDGDALHQAVCQLRLDRHLPTVKDDDDAAPAAAKKR